MTTLTTMLWLVLPYVCLTLFIAGMFWRWRHDKFGWTTRSSELHESVMLRLGSPLFHFGIIFVAIGHVMGLLIPKGWTETIGVSQGAYHLLATVGGGIAGIMATAGLVLLLYRRRTVGGVFHATSRNDKVMYILLALPIVLGMVATTMHQVFGGAHGYDYRETISPWLRGILTLQPEATLMVGVPLAFQLHIIAAFLLFAVWPYTRLVHAFSAPVGYPTRPAIVYRSREEGAPIRKPNRGWEPYAGPASLDTSSRTAVQVDRSDPQDV